MSIHDPEATTAEMEASIIRSLATIRKAWPAILDPTRGKGGRRTAPASRPPTSVEALSLMAEVTHDLAYWLHALLDDHDDALDNAGMQTVQIANVPVVVDVLIANATWMSGWEHGYRLAWELEDLARWCASAAWPKTAGTMAIGACPNTIGQDGEPVPCGTQVRVNASHPGDVKCRGCGLVDTIDGWILRMVGSERMVTIPQLVPLLHQRMGIVVHERTLRRWHRDGRFAAAGGSDGLPLFDRRHVFAALAWLEERAGRVS